MKLFDHQQKAVEWFRGKTAGALFHEIGCGKTLTALKIYESLLQYEKGLKLLVICPLSLIEGAWGEDINKFTEYKYCNLRKNKSQYIPLEKYDIFIINYESLKGNIVRIQQCNKWMIALDESSKMKNHSAGITKHLLSIRDYFKYRVIMSGTPAPNSEAEYWAQMRFLSDKIFHPKFFAFRNHYFHYSRGNMRVPIKQGQIIATASGKSVYSQGFQLAISEQRRQQMADRMAPWCNWVKKHDCLDLPETVDEIRYIEMKGEQLKAYREMKIEAITEIQNADIVAMVALTKIMKLRQITSGFAIDDKGCDRPIQGVNPKLNELKAILEEAGSQQIIIWGTFHYEIEKIRNDLGGSACTLYGKTKDREDSINGFKEGRYKYLVAHPKSAGHGLTFVNCHTQVFFSLDYSWESYEQARGRTDRAGQKCPPHMYTFSQNNPLIELYSKRLKGKKTSLK